MKRFSFLSLFGKNWINDTIVDTYCSMISERSKQINFKLFSSFFYENLLKKDQAKVKRWIKEKNVLDYELVAIPVNQNSHWTILVICPETKSVIYYDSLYYMTSDDSKVNN